MNYNNKLQTIIQVMKAKQLLLACLLAVAGSGTANAYDIDLNGLYYNVTGENTVEVTYVEEEDGNGDFFSGNINIPRRISSGGKTYTVTAIGHGAFAYCYDLTSITIPSSVTSIGERAFFNCSNLASITIPSSVTSIGDYAFYDCSNLASITIPSSVTSIGDYAFYSCWGLESITIPSSVTSIGEGAFSRSSYLSSIIVEEGNTVYDSRNGCNAIIEKKSNTLIAGCKNTVIPNSVTSIGNNAFRACSLTSITIPSSVTSIGEWAFYGCSNLASITIPSSVTSIGNDAFAGCSGLTSITIPESVNSIGEGAFERCSGIEAITVEKDNKVYDSRDGCNAIIEKKSNTLIAGCKNTVIPNSVTSIGNIVFFGCSGLTSITIPESVTSIGNQAFRGCSGLTSVTIPESVTSIGSSAFSSCSGLTSVTILGSVTSLGEGAFHYCSGLTSVTSYMRNPAMLPNSCFGDISPNCVLTIPYGTASKYASAGWTTSVFGGGILEIVPTINFADALVKQLCVANWDTNGDGELSQTEAAAVTSLGWVFNGKSIISFHELQYFTGLNSIRSNAFEECSGLTSITIPESVTSIGEEAFLYCSGLTSVTIPSSVTSIGNDAFYGCSGLTSVTIEEGVTSIGNDAFAECSGLTSITIPESVNSIGKGAFSGCSGLTSVTIPSSVRSIGHQAFYFCTGLASITVASGNSVYDSRGGCNAIIKTANNTLIAGCKNTTIPSSVMSIGYMAFGLCTGLTSVTIPGSVTSIGNYAFFACTGLTSVNIPSSVTSISDDAFYGCGSLTNVIVNNPVHVEIFSTTFTNRKNATLYVPAGSKATYLAADYWKEFKQIIEFIHGDVNSDDEVDVVDVVDIARYVVGTPSAAFVKPLADLNRDGNVNVADAVVLVNEIAGDQNFVKGLNAPQAGDYDYDLCELQLLRRSDGGLAFCLDGEADFTAFQCIVEVPEGTEVAAMRLNGGRRQGHQLLYNKVSDGTYRVAVLSVANNAFLGNEGELLGIALDGVADGDISIRDIHFVNTAGKDFTFDALHVGDGIVTGVEEMATTTSRQGTTEIYDLQGRLRPTLQRGVNIVGGKKRIVR